LEAFWQGLDEGLGFAEQGSLFWIADEAGQGGGQDEDVLEA
jgi:hypothetical protein